MIVIPFYKQGNSVFETYELSPGVFEVSDYNNTQDKLIEAFVFLEYITMKSKMKTNNKLKFDKKNTFLDNSRRLSP